MPDIRGRRLYGIDGAKLTDLSVTTAKLALLAVDTPQLALLAVENAQLGLLSVDTPQLAVDCISADAAGRALLETGVFDGTTVDDTFTGGSINANKIKGQVPSVASFNIPTGDVATMNATPVTVLPAPGAGFYTKVVSVHWWLDYGTVAYDAAAAGDILTLNYTDAAGAAVVDGIAGDTIGAAAADYHVLAEAVPELIPVEAAVIVAWIAAGEWFGAAGDSPLKCEIAYLTLPMEFGTP